MQKTRKQEYEIAAAQQLTNEIQDNTLQVAQLQMQTVSGQTRALYSCTRRKIIISIILIMLTTATHRLFATGVASSSAERLFGGLN